MDHTVPQLAFRAGPGIRDPPELQPFPFGFRTPAWPAGLDDRHALLHRPRVAVACIPSLLELSAVAPPWNPPNGCPHPEYLLLASHASSQSLSHEPMPLEGFPSPPFHRRDPSDNRHVPTNGAHHRPGPVRSDSRRNGRAISIVLGIGSSRRGTGRGYP